MSNEKNFSIDQDQTLPARKSGRAVFGEDGRGVWEWQTSPGVFTRDVTEEQLGALEASHLQLVDSEAVTLRRSQRALASMPLRTAVKSDTSATSGRLRRLLRCVARIIS